MPKKGTQTQIRFHHLEKPLNPAPFQIVPQYLASRELDLVRYEAIKLFVFEALTRIRYPNQFDPVIAKQAPTRKDIAVLVAVKEKPLPQAKHLTGIAFQPIRGNLPTAFHTTDIGNIQFISFIQKFC